MTSRISTPALILVRHAPVNDKYRGICYGSSDAELGPEGERLSYSVIEELLQWGQATVVHSGLQRTQFLAERLAAKLECTAMPCAALRERDFGTWELQAWNQIYAQHGDEMLRMISEPETYRPGGGETTFEMRDRVMQWVNSLPDTSLTIAVTHGGPIASLLGSQQRIPVTGWMELIPRCGQVVPIYKRPAKQD